MKNLKISQNYLINEEFVRQLIRQTPITKNDLVIEIGPGKGILTKIISDRAKKVIAVEIDTFLSVKLRNKFKEFKNIEIVNEDFLKYLLPDKNFKIFANPPFNISADIINKILILPNSINAAYLILQDKTVERYIGGPKYLESQTSIIWKPFYEISIIKLIPNHEFRPIPKVKIVFSQFIKRKKTLIDKKLFVLYKDFVIYSYNQWKPTIINSLDKIFTKKQLNIMAKKFDLKNLKPSELNIDQWIGLFDSFINFVTDEKKNLVKGFESKMKFKHKTMQKLHRTTVK